MELITRFKVKAGSQHKHCEFQGEGEGPKAMKVPGDHGASAESGLEMDCLCVVGNEDRKVLWFN